MLIRPAVVRSVGSFDARLFAYCEDVDFSLRARNAGFSVLVVPRARVRHAVADSDRLSQSIYYSTRNLLEVMRRRGIWYHWIGIVPNFLVRWVGFFTVLACLRGRPDFLRALASGVVDLREAGSGSGVRGAERPRRGPRLPNEGFFAPIAASLAARGPGTAAVIATSPAARLRWVFAYRTLVKYLVLKDIKVKSRGTYLGVAWTLMNPLVTIVTYFFVFQYIFRIGIPNFLAFFLVGFLMWTFFARAISGAATSVTGNDGLVLRAAFPLEVLPVASVFYPLFHHLVALSIAVPLMLIFWGAQLSWHLLWVAVILLAFVGFSLALALSFATVGVFFRDTSDILDVGLPVLFWATPIFYNPRWPRRSSGRSSS